MKISKKKLNKLYFLNKKNIFLTSSDFKYLTYIYYVSNKYSKFFFFNCLEKKNFIFFKLYFKRKCFNTLLLYDKINLLKNHCIFFSKKISNILIIKIKIFNYIIKINDFFILSNYLLSKNYFYYFFYFFKIFYITLCLKFFEKTGIEPV